MVALGSCLQQRRENILSQVQPLGLGLHTVPSLSPSGLLGASGLVCVCVCAWCWHPPILASLTLTWIPLPIIWSPYLEFQERLAFIPRTPSVSTPLKRYGRQMASTNQNEKQGARSLLNGGLMRQSLLSTGETGRLKSGIQGCCTVPVLFC